MTYKQLIKTRGFMEIDDIGFFRVEDQGEIELVVKDLREPEHFLVYTYDKKYGFNKHESFFPNGSKREKDALESAANNNRTIIKGMKRPAI
ncbi:hypothetical protein FACS1894120_2060 [Clostridia bacterium]|nr:hypothetical protein FACS1894120_2060 [Clostridia bacterium]